MNRAGFDADDNDRWSGLRADLLHHLDSEFARTASQTGFTTLPAAVKRAMKCVPRHLFVPVIERVFAYGNRPLPIEFNQTISQPFIVALMTALLEPQPNHVVLEIGTGSGYQTAILSHLVTHVYSVERIKDLADQAEERLDRLGYDNVDTKCADGTLGWPEEGPYDGILVTAGASEVPRPLLNQLKAGGRLVIPVENDRGGQYLKVITKGLDGSFEQRSILPVAFVPLVNE